MPAAIAHLRSWEDVAASKKAAILASIPEEWHIPASLMPPETQDDVTDWPKTSGFFTPEELSITGSTATELLPKLAKGVLSSETVTRAFCKRAAVAHQLVNCLSETCFERAISTAQGLDAHLAETGKPVGPLHGLPVSLKDCFNLAGLDATVGFASLVNDPAAADSTLAQLLQEAGAVFYVKTNTSTAMMMAESVNHVFGRTVNPRNRRLTSGGSSGGESALIALGGSCLGVGTDIGGSLRLPAACTGIFTLRPSFGRFPTLGCRSGMAGQEAVPSVNGPMARALADITLYSEVVVGSQPWLADPRGLPIPWRPVVFPPGKKLRIGVLWDDGVVLPTPPVTRALTKAAEKLQAAGHELIDWAPTDHGKLADILQRMFVADGGKSIRKQVEAGGEPWWPAMHSYEVAHELGTYDMWQLHLERVELQKRYLDRWNAAGIDAILGPTTPFSTVEHGKYRHVGYTGVFNVLDYSCVSFPSGILADEKLDAALGEKHQPLSDTCRLVHAEYNARAVHGMPVNLQLTARRLEEEKVLEMCKIVLDTLC